MGKKNKKHANIKVDKDSFSKTLKELLSVPPISNAELKKKYSKKKKPASKQNK